MSNPLIAKQLVERYFDDALSQSEMIELERCLADDADAREAFAAAAQEDQRLRAFFQSQHSRSRAEDILSTVVSAATEATDLVGTPTRDSAAASGMNGRPSFAPNSLRMMGWCVAATILSICGAALYWNWSPTRRTGPLAHEVVAGAVAVNGAQMARIPQGAAVDVTSSAHAVIRLMDGSIAELAPGSRAVFQGPVESFRQVIALDRGTGRFQVEKGRREFRVQTSVGAVTALGTEFTVEVRQPERFESVPDNVPTDRGLIVAVLAGQVEVDYRDQIYPLVLGDNRIYIAEADEARTEPDVVGNVVDLRPEGPGVTSITIETRKTRAQSQREYTFLLTGETQYSWVNIPVDRQLPSLGYMAAVWRSEGGGKGVAAVCFTALDNDRPPPDMRGRIVDVSPDGQRLTLELMRRSKQEPPQTRTVKIGPETAVTYFFVRFDAERPTIGQQAMIWLDSRELAAEIHLAGDKRGAYRPDFTGRVTAISADGKEIELLESGKRSAQSENGSRRVVQIASNTKVVHQGMSSRPSIGEHASIWLQPGSTNVAAGIRIGESEIQSPRKRK